MSLAEWDYFRWVVVLEDRESFSVVKLFGWFVAIPECAPGFVLYLDLLFG